MAITKLQPFNLDATANYTFANIFTDNANLGNAATANFFIGSGNNLSNIQGSNVSGQVANALISGTVYTNAQPNITSVGTLTGLTSTGTADLTGASNVALGPVANVHITGGSNGQYLQTDGAGILSWSTVSSGSTSNISNGNSNVSIATANGNITMSAVGNSNIVVVTGTGVNVAGTLNVSGNTTVANLSTTGSGGNISNVNVVSANTFTASGNITASNANLGNAVTANYFIGNFYGTANLATYATTANAVAGANVSGQVGNALISGTVYTNAQPNITSVGTLSSLTVTGNATVGNIVTSGSGGNIGNANVISANTFIASGNITAGNANLGNNVSANFFTGNGVYLTGITTAGLSNGNSNINIPSSNGNINFTAVGNTNMVITGTGVNVAGTLNVTGNANLGNLGVTGVTATTLSGSLTTASQPNITSTGTLTSITVSGSGSFGANVNMNSFNITNLATPVASTDAATKQYVDDVAQGLNVHDSVAAATPDTLATITGGTITYNNGSSGVGATLTTTGIFNLIDGVNVQTSGTRILVKNEANAVFNGIYTWSNVTAITRAADYNSVPEVEAGDFVFCIGGTLYDNTGWVQTSTISAIGTPGNNIEFTQFSGAGTYQAGTGLTLTGTTFSVNASQTQITSLGTLTGLSVNGNITAANVTANTGVFTGNGSGLNAIAGANVTGAVSYATTANSVAAANITGTITATTAGTVTTNAQPNITSTGTLTSLSVTGNITSGNANLGNTVTANFFTGNGIYLTGITSSGVANGNSNISIPSANGNINFSAIGNANILVVTGTGVNVAGTLNVTGNTTVGNLITSGSGGNVSNVNVISANTFIASGNITAGNANLGNAVTANFFIGSGNNLSNIQGANVSGQVANALISGTVYTNAQPNITSTGTLTSLAVTGNITAGNANLGNLATANFFSGNGSLLTGIIVSAGNTIVNGNSNVTVTANGNVNTSVAGNANILVVTGTGANIAGTLNVSGNTTVANLSTTGSGGNISNVNVVSANTFTASGNITSGNANLGNAVTANFFVGTLYGTANLATFASTANSVAGANVSGQVANALISGTVYTNAQPNITSVGSLTGLTISNATGIVDFTTTANVTLGAVGNLHISGGTNAYVLSTDGSGNLSWVAQTGGGGGGSSISNGNSNVNIPTANGNINFTAVGNTNMVITGTGINVAGTLNTTGNVALSGANVSLGNVSNLHITGGSNTYVLSTDGAGNLNWVIGSSTSIGVDNFTGNGVQTSFTLSTTPANINCTLVSLAGLFQPRTVYSLTGNIITFSSAPANTAPIEVTTFTSSNGGGGGGITAQDLLSPFLLMGA